MVRRELQRLFEDRNRPLEVGKRMARMALSRLSILPLGQALCRFWLNPDNHLLACLIRTTESDYQHGEPGYDLLVFSLDEDEFEALSCQARLHGDMRLRVTRVADLLEQGLGRGLGRNHLVFQLGSWTKVQPRGMFFGSIDVPEDLKHDVHQRLSPISLSQCYDALTSRPEPCASRTLNWLRSTSWESFTEAHGIDLGPWVAGVRVRAEALLQVPARSNEGLLYARFALRDEAEASRILERGFTELEEAGDGLFDRFITFLYDSGRRPVRTDEQTLSHDVSEVLAPLMNRTDAGWDVVAATKS